MNVWAVVGAVAGVGALFFAALAWLDSRPYQPFLVTPQSNGVFGLQSLRWLPVVVEYVRIPHHTALRLANESGLVGPFTIGRGDRLFFDLSGMQPSVDIEVLWHPRIGLKRKTQVWATHVL